MPNDNKMLFERIGGRQMITEVVDDFYDRVLADPELKPFLKNLLILAGALILLALPAS